MNIFGKYRYIHLLIDYIHIVLIKYILCETKAELLLLSHSVISKSLWPHGLQHTRLFCPSPSPESCSKSCPLSWWCHPTISSSVVPFIGWVKINVAEICHIFFPYLLMVFAHILCVSRPLGEQSVEEHIKDMFVHPCGSLKLLLGRVKSLLLLLKLLLLSCFNHVQLCAAP